MLLGVADHYDACLFMPVSYLQRHQAQMVVGYFYRYLLRPDLLVHQLIPVVNCYYEVDRAFECGRFVFCDVQREEKRIFRGAIDTERQGPFLEPEYFFRVNENLIDTEPEPFAGINQRDFKLLILQQPIIINGNPSIFLKNPNGRFHIIRQLLIKP